MPIIFVGLMDSMVCGLERFLGRASWGLYCLATTLHTSEHEVLLATLQVEDPQAVVPVIEAEVPHLASPITTQAENIRREETLRRLDRLASKLERRNQQRSTA